MFCLKTCGKPRAEVRLQAHNLIEYDNLEERTWKGSLFLLLRNNNANVLWLKISRQICLINIWYINKKTETKELGKIRWQILNLWLLKIGEIYKTEGRSLWQRDAPRDRRSVPAVVQVVSAIHQVYPLFYFFTKNKSYR